MRSRRKQLKWSQEKVGVLICIDESSGRARYVLGTHKRQSVSWGPRAALKQISVAFIQNSLIARSAPRLWLQTAHPVFPINRLSYALLKEPRWTCETPTILS